MNIANLRTLSENELKINKAVNMFRKWLQNDYVDIMDLFGFVPGDWSFSSTWYLLKTGQLILECLLITETKDETIFKFEGDMTIEDVIQEIYEYKKYLLSTKVL